VAKSGYIKGKPHKDGGIQAINTSTGEPLEVEGGEVITCTKVVDDPKIRTLKGTNIEILDQMQRTAGCRAILSSVKNGTMKTYKKGGSTKVKGLKPKSYEAGYSGELWSTWDRHQRLHFIDDHFPKNSKKRKELSNELKSHKMTIEDLSYVDDYDIIPDIVQRTF